MDGSFWFSMPTWVGVKTWARPQKHVKHKARETETEHCYSFGGATTPLSLPVLSQLAQAQLTRLVYLLV
jgi:hypothetical protein